MTRTITISIEEAMVALAEYAFKKGYILEDKIVAKSIELDIKENTLAFEYQPKSK